MEDETWLRSPELLSRTNSALLVVDLQQKLTPFITDAKRIIWNVERLMDGAALFEIPCTATEQYPAGLGPSVSEVTARVAARPSKQRFSCRGCGGVPDDWAAQGRSKIVVCGIETHVCVLQTVIDLLSDGFQVHVVADAVGSRNLLDYQIALRRAENYGATVTTTETVLFEWCETAADPQFKQISALVRQSPPA